jgi:hypothetical protein
MIRWTRKGSDVVAVLSPEERSQNHVPDWVFALCREHNVYIEDEATGELIQVLDLRTEAETRGE